VIEGAAEAAGRSAVEMFFELLDEQREFVTGVSRDQSSDSFSRADGRR
jgi:hypothetical protein